MSKIDVISVTKISSPRKNFYDFKKKKIVALVHWKKYKVKDF